MPRHALAEPYADMPARVRPVCQRLVWRWCFFQNFQHVMMVKTMTRSTQQAKLAAVRQTNATLLADCRCIQQLNRGIKILKQIHVIIRMENIEVVNKRLHTSDHGVVGCQCKWPTSVSLLILLPKRGKRSGFSGQMGGLNQALISIRQSSQGEIGIIYLFYYIKCNLQSDVHLDLKR